MERLLFSKLEVWVVGLLAIAAFGGTLLFGTVVLESERGSKRFGAVGDVALTIAEMPKSLTTLLRGEQPMVAPLGSMVDGRAGWTMEAGAATGLTGYLLLSRYDGDASRHVIELRSLPDGGVRHRWLTDADAWREEIGDAGAVPEDGLESSRRYRAIHPYLLDNGDLLIKDHYSLLFRIDPCGGLVWHREDYLFHHSTEADGEGGFWIPVNLVPPSIEGTAPDFSDNGIARLGPDGQVAFVKSLTEAMIENGLFPVLFTLDNYTGDPLHLNDIQPVLQDGPYWKAGDLFLSLRNRSMILLYRPPTNEILWMKQGPWISQHDVDIIDDHTIAVFNNNTYDKGRGAYVLGVSDVVFYDFATDTVSAPFHAAMERNAVKTATEGLFDLMPSGHLLVEQENAGRILILSPGGDVAAEFVNRAQDGLVYGMGWSRYLTRTEGDEALRHIGGGQCEP